jgi:hypothetical protein
VGDARRVDRLHGAPVPDDVEIVEALVVDVEGIRRTRGLPLRRLEVAAVELDANAEIGFGLRSDLVEKRYLCAEMRRVGRSAVWAAGAARRDLAGARLMVRSFMPGL